MIQAPERVARAVRRLCPRLRLEYSRVHRRFVLLVRGKKSGQVSILRVLNAPGGRFVRPTLGLLMPMLKQSYVGHLTSAWARDRFENDIERHNAQLEQKSEARARDLMRREGAPRLAHEFRKLPGMLGRG